MPLESATYISDLDPTNPVGSSDLVSSLDDHMRLVKATLQTTFPGIAGAVTATHTELNFLDGVTGTTGTGKLVLDNAPTIAALTVTGSITLPARSVADAALSDNVPLKNAPNTWSAQQFIQTAASDARLDLWRTSAPEDGGRYGIITNAAGQLRIDTRTDAGVFGEAIMLVDRTGTNVDSIAFTADAITLNGVNVTDYARLSQINTFTKSFDFSDIGYGLRLASADPGIEITETAAAADNRKWAISADDGVLRISALTDAHNFTHVLEIARSGGTPTTINFSNGAVRAATIANSTSTTLVAGQVHAVTNNATLPNMTAGQWVGVINDSAAPITVTKSASDTMYWTASGASVTSVTVAARGKATFFCANGTNVYASGNITGSS